MATFLEVLFGGSQKKKPPEEKHEHNAEIDRLLKENKHIRGYIDTPDSVNEV